MSAIMQYRFTHASPACTCMNSPLISFTCPDFNCASVHTRLSGGGKNISNTRTFAPAANNTDTICPPKNPPPPVTRISSFFSDDRQARKRGGKPIPHLGGGGSDMMIGSRSVIAFRECTEAERLCVQRTVDRDQKNTTTSSPAQNKEWLWSSGLMYI